MISLQYLSRLKILAIFFAALIFSPAFSEEETIDIWKVESEQNNQGIDNSDEKKTVEENIIFSDEINETKITIDENEIQGKQKSVIGIFDPKDNNFNLNMWSQTDGSNIKKILQRIDKLKLSKLSEDLLFKVLFTNAYPPEKNLSSEEFLDIKINWLIKKKRIKDLEVLLKNNPEVGSNSKAIKFLINEYLSSVDIKSACNKINFIDRNVKNIYLDKFIIYCLINNNRNDEAQLIFDLLKEKNFKEVFFEDKINFLLGLSETTTKKTADNNLLNFHLSHITNDNFQYEPEDNTDKYIWRYMSSANLLKIDNFDDENIVSTYELAAEDNSFENDEIFKIYLKMKFNFNQLINATEIYKNLPGYKARGLIYQSILLADDPEKKISLAFLLKDLFLKDKLFNIYQVELSNILQSIDPNEIPKNYEDLVKKNIDKNLALKIKFDNEILHRSKIIRHFFDSDVKLSRTEKDFKAVYKKIKKNKRYFISIKDIIVLESLTADGILLPDNLDFSELSSELTIPNNLKELVDKNKTGLVMLKIVEIIGEDKVTDLDPETLYFLNSILNDLNLKQIRNNILSKALPARV